MATESEDRGEEDLLFNVTGIYPEAVEEFQERLPEVDEGDYFIGGRLREDFKQFVYSGLVSEFPVRGESVFIVTDRGEEVSNGYDSREDVVASQQRIARDEAYKVFDARTDDIVQALITEDLLSMHRREQEHELKDAEGESWEKYLDLGNEMLNRWEETYHRAERSDSEQLQEYADILGGQVEKLTEDLIRLADRQDGRYIESVRNTMYELENLTERV